MNLETTILSNSLYSLILRVLIFDIIVSFAIAKLEIEIEGKYGWAQNLPTWRIKNKWTQVLWGQQPYTGYHFWLLATVLIFLHLPFFVVPSIWSITNQMLLFANLGIAVILEDYFWFVFNPHYGIHKFNKTHAPWHKDWLFKMPLLYFKLGALTLLFYASAIYFS